MKGFSVFLHSVKLVFNNLNAAFMISLVPYGLSAIAYFFVADAITAMQSRDQGLVTTAWQEKGGLLFLYMSISVFAALWIAVAWHRYVLLEERQSGALAPFHGKLMLNYFGKGILLALIIIPLTLLLLGFGVRVLGFALGGAGAILVQIIVTAAVLFVYLRLCAALPATAIGSPMSFGEAWDTTRNIGGSIVVLAIASAVGVEILMLFAKIAPGTLIGTIIVLFVDWIRMLVGISILTTFYGHFIEGREID